MHKFANFAFGCLFLSVSSPLFADLSSVRASGLPQETAILAAYEDAKMLEPYARGWSPEWKYDIPKQEAGERLSKDLALLQVAAKSHAENTELALLTGVVGRFAYNLDIDGSYDTTLTALRRATELAPQDIRGPWFRAAFICSTASPIPGAEEFLAVEAGYPLEQVPAGFWQDYMQCMHVVNMPTHVLRAAKYLESLKDSDSGLRDFFVTAEQKRFNSVDKTKVYEDKETWSSIPAGTDVMFVNLGCGIGIRVHPNWQVGDLRLAKGDCKANFAIGPYGEKKDMADVTIFVESQKPNEPFHDFLFKYMPKGYDLVPQPVDGCPVSLCSSYRVVQTGNPTERETKHYYIVAFARDEPEFPGLAFESPQFPKIAAGSEEPAYFRPDQLLRRVPGKIYYEVDIGIEPEIERQALEDLAFLLRNLKVD